MILKYLIMIGVNFGIPYVARSFALRRPIPWWASFLLYCVVMVPLNTAWAIAWGLDRRPGVLFFFAFLYIMSSGYQSKRKARQEQKQATADDNAIAADTLKRATKLFAMGKKHDALNEYRSILTFQPNSDSAEMARMYAAQIERDIQNEETPTKGSSRTGDPRGGSPAGQP